MIYKRNKEERNQPARGITMKNMAYMTEVELREYFTWLARRTEEVLPDGPSRKGKSLFVLLVFDDPGACQYVSNCSRENMVRALRESADRLERREDIARVEGQP